MYCHCWLEASAAKEVGRNFGERAAQAACSQRVSDHCPQTQVTASPRQEIRIASKTTIPQLSGFSKYKPRQITGDVRKICIQCHT